MKKVLSLVLIAVLCFGLMAGCGSEEELAENLYDAYDLPSMVTLPDYNGYSFEEEEVTVTDEDIDDTVQVFLEGLATTEEVTEGTVEKGDTVKIAFEGVLDNGYTSDGMKSEGTTITLGNAGYIDGFEAGLYGATIGEEVALKLQFPENYGEDELNGQPVTFKVTVLSKTVSTIPELTDKLVKENSNYKTIEKFREAAAEELEKLMKEEEVIRVKGLIYDKLFGEAEVPALIEEEVQREMDRLEANYKDIAEIYGQEWEEFLETNMSFTEEEFLEELKTYGEDIVKSKMIVYTFARAEEIAVTQEEYDAALEEAMLSLGVSEPSLFEMYMGCTIEEYGELNHIHLNLTLDKALDKIYPNVVKNAAA
ncbi:MAG: trigger factor [Firmicutes bacterium]|nr:trigger factor [Bacillota bacterium]MBR3705715.1 trigger factor [Bacillota bacterium]MBR6584569.1 trigger factor [Bacillota bacterium]